MENKNQFLIEESVLFRDKSKINSSKITDEEIADIVDFKNKKMNIVLTIGINILFDKTKPDRFFEINEFGNPMYPSLINKKVMEFSDEEHKDIPIFTQSEHVLNGFRVRLKNKTINSLKIIYFKNDVIYNIKVDENGGIDDWADDFFDQTNKDFKELFGF